MKKTLFLILGMLSMGMRAQETTSVPTEMRGGFPIANFAISAQVPQDGAMYGHVWVNTGKLGGWLQDCGTLALSLSRNGEYYALADFPEKKLNRNFPIVQNHYGKNKQIKMAIETETFCPIVSQQAEETALPVILLQVHLKALADEEFQLCLVPEHTDLVEVYTHEESHWVEGKEMQIPVQMKKGEERDVRVALVHYDSSWVSALRFADGRQVADYALRHYEMLKAGTLAYQREMPVACDNRVDPYLQYYMLPALVLTRMNRDGEVLTMGYCELNQRDSFWTSWMHLIHFRELEWKMIEESYQAMRPSGKIPTCILPEIERWDDLDINLFLILRTARYYALYRNTPQLQKIWSSACRVMDWVIGRDMDHVGMPQQVSFWGDWKDVPFMSERKYSPFVAMLYLAALDQMVKMADICGDKERAGYYRVQYEKAYGQVNKSTDEGGLWNGRYYDQIWKDGTAKDYLCQDQMVGVMYDVIPRERAESIMDALNELALTPYGVCNMVPYLPGVEYPEAVYHNGAMWPWTSFMDCWARIHAGRKEEALDIMQRVIRTDILDTGDYVPNEHINTLTGENLGFPVQGWNANLFGLVYFALQYPDLPYKL